MRLARHGRRPDDHIHILGDVHHIDPILDILNDIDDVFDNHNDVGSTVDHDQQLTARP